METNTIKTRNEFKATHADTEVLIVGAGLTGLALACDLLRRGIHFRIIDKSADYFPGSRGKGLTPRSLEVLEDLGVIDQLMPYMFHPIIRQYDGSTVLKDEDPHEGLAPTPNTPYASPLWIPQFQIEHTLRERLSKGDKSVELATELTAIEQNENIVTATVQKNGEIQHIKCLYLVASDGAHSFARKFLQVGFAGETRDAIRMLVGDVHTDALDHEHTHMWNKHPDGIVALTPFPKFDIFQFQAQVAPDFEAAPTLELFQQILQERTGMDIQLYDPTWLSSFKVNIRMVDRSVIGRVCIAGDAAHVHSPTGGQGMNTGIQDAYNLGWKLGLVLRGTNARLVETYQEERLPVAASVLKLTTKLLDKFLSLQRSLPSGSDRFQLSLNYRESSLSEQATSLQLPLQAGDRASDAPLQDGKGVRIRLFDLFRGPHFSLLYTGDIPMDELIQLTDKYRDIKLFGISQPADCKTADGFIDADGYFSSAYGEQKNVIYLVRPDGYIGFIGDNSKVRELTVYIDQLLMPDRDSYKISKSRAR
jgi:2-polyprenyl-6-methoxyphenol hydroxylase-like FAD-dependent oxidoreductase